MELSERRRQALLIPPYHAQNATFAAKRSFFRKFRYLKKEEENVQIT